MSYRYEDNIEEARMRRRRKKREEMRRRKRQQRIIRKCIMIGIPVLVLLIAGIMIINAMRNGKHNDEAFASENPTVPVETVISINETPVVNHISENQAVSENEPQEDTTVYSAEATADTGALSGEVVSSYGIMVDVDNHTILAQRDAKTRISPASMTKILTVLVAAEHITEEELDDTVTMTIDITDYSFQHDCSNVGFSLDEEVPVRDLFYGTILPSGADAAVALATYVAGSQEAFIDLMNEKLETLGLSDTAHFTNCVGLYDEDHYCTAYDMAMILEAAVNNDFCREVLSEHTYTTTKTAEHPDGIEISNWFLRRIEDKETSSTVLCAKTGYVAQSGNCAASYATTEDGHGYICVTANSTSAWRCIYDHVAIYQQFLDTTNGEFE